jgi:site-specific DNA-cytosine methylase
MIFLGFHGPPHHRERSIIHSIDRSRKCAVGQKQGFWPRTDKKRQFPIKNASFRHSRRILHPKIRLERESLPQRRAPDDEKTRREARPAAAAAAAAMAISLLKLPLPSTVAADRSVYKLLLSGPGEHRYASSPPPNSRSFVHRFSESAEIFVPAPSIFVAFVFPA